MKKIFRFVLIFTLFVSCIAPAYALTGFGGGDRGPGWSGGGFGNGREGAWRDYIAWGLEDIANRLTTVSGRLAYTVNGVTYSAGSSLYTIRARIIDLASSVSSISGYVDGVEGYIDQIEGRLISHDYTVATSAYNTWQKTISIANSLDSIDSHLLTDQDGTTYKASSLIYYCWDRLKSIDSKLSTANSRLSDVITAFNNLSVDLNLDDVNLSISGDSVQLSPNMAYCAGYRTDASGANYPTYTIPYDSATDIVARLNTDYMAKAVTVLDRSGSTSTRYVRSATLRADGFIQVKLTNGYSYYLCDNTNTLFVADSASSLSGIQDSINSLSANFVSFENTLSNYLDISSDIDVPSFDDSAIVDWLTSIHTTLSNLDTTPVVSVSDSPYVRKIYNALYGGVDGTGADIVDIASSQLGITEGYPYYSWYGFDSHVPWCACFVSWCADQCGYLDDVIPKFALVDDGVSWFHNHGLWLSDGAAPSAGDIIFFDWDSDDVPDHVGIVASFEDDVVYTIEGNKGDSPGAVDTRSISVDSPLIMGYGTPDYPASGSSGASVYSVLSDISYKLDNLTVSDSFDETALLSKLTDIENALSNLGDNVSVSIEQVSNVDIAIDNSAHDVFYVTDDDGEKSIVDLSGDSIKVVGKLMNFLYQAMFKDALDDAGSCIDGLYDFYLDDSEGVDVWAS